MNIELRKNAKNDFEKDHCKLLGNSVFGKRMENVRNHCDIKLVTIDIKRNKLVLEPNYNTTKSFSENLLAIELKKTVIKANKPIYLGLAILSLSKIKMYDHWYNDIRLKYDDNVKLCYIDTDSFIMNIKREDFYKDSANDVEKKYDTSNYPCERPLPMSKNKNVPGLFNDEFGEKIMKRFVGLRPKCYSYLTNENKVDKRAKGTKKCLSIII